MFSRFLGGAMAPKKCIVLKFGSGILTRPSGAGLDPKQFSRLTAAVAEVVRRGHQCVIVSSGAVAAGVSALGLRGGRADLVTGRGSAAEGGSELMRVCVT